MKYKVEDIKPFRDEVIIKKSKLQLDSSEIFMLEDRNKKVNLYEVVCIGRQCKYLKVGDIIGVGFHEHTVPIEIDNVMYASVSEKDVWFVVNKND